MEAKRILEILDGFLHKNDYVSAEAHLLACLKENNGDVPTEILIRNELMGLYRKLGRREEALDMVAAALSLIDRAGLSENVGAATTRLNAATIYKAFGLPEKALPLFERAKALYERELSPADSRLGGLYNNMGLALVDLGRFAEAKALYQKAVAVMDGAPRGNLEVAITLLNLASAAEAELGLLEGDETIAAYLEKAETLLDAHPVRDGYYAFVCEKCATVFGYYGWFLTEKRLKSEAERIYGQ